MYRQQHGLQAFPQYVFLHSALVPLNTQAYTNLSAAENSYFGNWVSFLYCFNVSAVEASYYNSSYPMQLLFEFVVKAKFSCIP